MRDADARYHDAIAQFGAALQRLARASEADPERRRDLLQEMHVALWRSFATFDGRCSLSTWVYRVAHNVAAQHIDKERRGRASMLTLDDIEHLPAESDPAATLESADALTRLTTLIRALTMPDRQVMTLYLEGLDAEEITQITGLSPGAVATRISRLKTRLARLINEPANV